MLRANESKFSLSLEVRQLWERLQMQGRTGEFETEFWKTIQGIMDEQALKRRNQVAVKVTIEQRPDDNMQHVYIETRPIKM